MLRQPCSDGSNFSCCCNANFFTWSVASYGRSDSIKDYEVPHLPILAVCAQQVQMNYRPIVFPWFLMILGAPRPMGELKKNEKHSCAPQLASVPVFYTCKLSFLVIENNQTRHYGMNIAQRRAVMLCLLSDLLFQRALEGAWKAFVNKDGRQLAEHAAALWHPPRGFPGAAALSSHVCVICRGRGRVLASPLPAHVAPVPSPHIPNSCLQCLITTSYQGDFWHIHMFGFPSTTRGFLPLSLPFTGSFF